jgi:hypothetical protein
MSVALMPCRSGSSRGSDEPWADGGALLAECPTPGVEREGADVEVSRRVLARLEGNPRRAIADRAQDESGE